MEKFNLEEYLKNPSRKVVTRDGRKVRIICTDMNYKNHPIVELIAHDNDTENIYTYTKDGEWDNYESTTYDLFFAPEKHEGWANLYKLANKDCAYYTGGVFNSKSEAENKRDTSDLYVATIKFEWEE